MTDNYKKSIKDSCDIDQQCFALFRIYRFNKLILLGPTIHVGIV